MFQEIPSPLCMMMYHIQNRPPPAPTLETGDRKQDLPICISPCCSRSDNHYSEFMWSEDKFIARYKITVIKDL
jgi:hypothetical protein